MFRRNRLPSPMPQSASDLSQATASQTSQPPLVIPSTSPSMNPNHPPSTSTQIPAQQTSATQVPLVTTASNLPQAAAPKKAQSPQIMALLPPQATPNHPSNAAPIAASQTSTTQAFLIATPTTSTVPLGTHNLPYKDNEYMVIGGLPATSSSPPTRSQ